MNRLGALLWAIIGAQVHLPNINMNISPVLLTIIFVISIMTSNLLADPSANIPADSWEQIPNGPAVAIFLSYNIESGDKKSSIKVYIKNTSKTIKYLPANTNDRAIQIFYVRNDGTHVPLRDYTVKPPSNVLMPPMPDSRPYEPGEIAIKTIDLSPDERVIVKEHPILCRFYISNQEVGGYQKMESTPKMLTNEP